MTSAGKKIAIGLALAMMLVTCSCSKKESSSTTAKDPAPAPKMEPATYEKYITGQDVYATGWYHEYLSSHTTVKVTQSDPSSGVTWRVYFTEEELPEDQIETLLEREPNLIDNGSFNATNFDYIYIFCDRNSNNSETPTDDQLKIWYQATYA